MTLGGIPRVGYPKKEGYPGGYLPYYSGYTLPPYYLPGYTLRAQTAMYRHRSVPCEHLLVNVILGAKEQKRPKRHFSSLLSVFDTFTLNPGVVVYRGGCTRVGVYILSLTLPWVYTTRPSPGPVLYRHLVG